MNPRIQSTLVILSTLVIGMILGALLWSSIVTQRTEQLERLRRAERWNTFIEGAIQPRDEEQRQAIQAIVDENHQAFRSIMEELRSIRDSLHIKLAPILDDEQEERLKNALGRRDFRRGRGRPFIGILHDDQSIGMCPRCSPN